MKKISEVQAVRKAYNVLSKKSPDQAYRVLLSCCHTTVSITDLKSEHKVENKAVKKITKIKQVERMTRLTKQEKSCTNKTVTNISEKRLK